MATAIKSRAHPIPLGQDFSTGTSWAFGWIRRRLEKGKATPLGVRHVGQASRRYRNMPTAVNLTNHQSPFPGVAGVAGVTGVTGVPRVPRVPRVIPTHSCPSALDWSTIFASGDDLS
jgi:hypothetical protein